MEAVKYDLIVIGAGPGGYEAAAHAGKMKGKMALLTGTSPCEVTYFNHPS